jgi:hypothetical protein
MNENRFDGIAKLLAKRRLSRRSAMRAAGVTAGAAALGRTALAAAQDATPAAGAAGLAEDKATLFVQTAAGGTFVRNPNAGKPLATAASPVAVPGASPTPAVGGQYLLTLTGHAGETIAFSDRPQRNFGEVKTTNFFKTMGFTPANPPNAALVADTPDQDDDVLLVELLNPNYDAGKQTLTYEANILSGYQGEMLKPIASKQKDQQLAASFTTASLFIDDCPDAAFYCTTPDAWIGCYTAGVFNQGTCWYWPTLSCVECWDYSSICNQLYPDFCKGNCIVKTTHDLLCDCEGNC